MSFLSTLKLSVNLFPKETLEFFSLFYIIFKLLDKNLLHNKESLTPESQKTFAPPSLAE